MPRYPDFAGRISSLPGSVYERFSAQLKKHGKNLVKLHIGDTYQHPVYPVQLERALMDKHPDYNRYCNTFGVQSLRAALTEKLNADNGLNVTPGQILVTGGAVQALNIGVSALINPGEAVMTLTPCWPFFPGIVRLTGGEVLEVPFYVKLREEPGMDIRAYLERHLTPETAALYLNTPNNPGGSVLTGDQILAIAGFVKDHGLWLISDEAYDGLTFDGARHHSAGSIDGMAERTITVFTFSKIFMFAGLRVGYAVAAAEVIQRMNKIMVHQLYGPATFAQYMMVDPVNTRHAWMQKVRDHYQKLRDAGLARATFQIPKPEGAYFYFFSVRDYLHGREYWDVVTQIMERGVAVAPGCDFGTDFKDYIRICFTGEPPEKFLAAMDTVNSVLNP